MDINLSVNSIKRAAFIEKARLENTTLRQDFCTLEPDENPIRTTFLCF